MEEDSDELLFLRGRSSSSLKLLSWLGSKSSSAAMLSMSRLTAPLEGCRNTFQQSVEEKQQSDKLWFCLSLTQTSRALRLALAWFLWVGLRGASLTGLHRLDGLMGSGESFDFFF